MPSPDAPAGTRARNPRKARAAKRNPCAAGAPVAGTPLASAEGMFIRRILVATDFSPRSQAALRYAMGLARALSAELDLLHVIPPPARTELVIGAYLGRALPAVDTQLLGAARTRLEGMLAEVSHEGVRTTLLVEPGDPAATVVRMATEIPSDLIVLGTHARIGLAELVIGSVAHRVITCAPCPVVTLRGDEVGDGAHHSDAQDSGTHLS